MNRYNRDLPPLATPTPNSTERLPVSATDKRLVTTSCSFDCGARCHLRVQVADGRVTHIGTEKRSEFGLTACVRGLSQRDVLYAPDFGGHGGTATSSLGFYTPLSPVSQTAVSGTGTLNDPLRVTTEVDVGATQLRIIETNSYTIGQESFRTDIVVENRGVNEQQMILYRALDCYLAGSDFGYGLQAATMVGCSVNPNNELPGRLEDPLVERARP